MNIKKFLIIFISILSICAFTACESKGPAEKAGEKIDQTLEKVSDNTKAAVDAVKDKAE